MKKKDTKILLVDDEPDLLEFVGYNLKNEGYQVFTAKNGEEAVSKAKKYQPHLIILDVMMPKMDGYEACGKLKNDEKTRNIPVILFTGKAQDDFKEIGDKVGADAFVEKPFDAKVLLGKIEELLKK